ncbi:MAG TPA: site-specific integrase [Rhodanobacteraceae bacterium]|nr:site-specific integrase [Rhodanobacteraceae bacterium]
MGDYGLATEHLRDNMKLKLTKSSVQKLRPDAQPYEVNDTELTGLILRVQPSGHKSFIMQFGRGRRRTIGNAAVLTVEQARVTARRWLAERDEGKLPPAARGPAKRVTLGEFIEKEYKPWCMANRKAGGALVSALPALFGNWYGDPLSAITAWKVEKLRVARLKTGIKPATANRDIDRIRSILSKAVEWGRLESHPLRTVKRHKVDNSRVRYLDVDEERRLRTTLDSREKAARQRRHNGNVWMLARHREPRTELGAYCDHLQPLVLVAINTGLRRGELFSLEWRDVDLSRADLVVRAEVAKSGKARHVPLNAEAGDVLKRWKQQAADNGLVFPGRGGARMTNINTAWATLCTDAQLDDFHFHDCRHHFASKLVMAGADLNTVRELLGHADITMTLRYAHLAPEHKARAVDMLTPPGKRIGRRAK